jgi:hypothetical protein
MLNLKIIQIMSKKNFIGFQPSYMKNNENAENVENIEVPENKTELDNNTFQNILENITKQKTLTNEMLILSKIEAYIALIKSPDFYNKLDFEKDLILADLLLFQSIYTELSTYKTIVK